MRAVLIAAMLAGTALGQDAACLLPIVTAPVGTPIAPAAWYKLDGNALDSSGNNATGTVSGVEAYQAGIYGQALTVSNSYMTASCCIGATNAITVAGWFRLDASQMSAMVGRYNTAVSKRVWVLYFNPIGGVGNTVEWVVSADGAFPAADLICRLPGQLIADGKWRHFAGTWTEGDVLRLYIDGVLVLSSTNPQTSMYQTDVATTIGAMNAGASYQMRGASDDVRIYDRALSPANIQRIMTGQDVAPIEELQ